MLDWLAKNKEWVFSGAGVAVFGLIWQLLHKKTSKTEALTVSPTIEQQPSLTQSPVINNIINPAPSGISAREPRAAHVPKARPKIFSLAPLAEARPVEEIDTILSTMHGSLEVCVARFKLAADDSTEIAHEFEASIEYVDLVHTNARPRTIENTVCRINQARWLEGHTATQVMQKGKVYELLLVFQLNGRLYALKPGEKELEQYMIPVPTRSSPYVRITLVDLNFGIRWRVEYRVFQHPLSISEVSAIRASS